LTVCVRKTTPCPEGSHLDRERFRMRTETGVITDGAIDILVSQKVHYAESLTG
jgi:hypothetical protein